MRNHTFAGEESCAALGRGGNLHGAQINTCRKISYHFDVDSSGTEVINAYGQRFAYVGTVKTTTETHSIRHFLHESRARSLVPHFLITTADSEMRANTVNIHCAVNYLAKHGTPAVNIYQSQWETQTHTHGRPAHARHRSTALSPFSVRLSVMRGTRGALCASAYLAGALAPPPTDTKAPHVSASKNEEEIAL